MLVFKNYIIFPATPFTAHCVHPCGPYVDRHRPRTGPWCLNRNHFPKKPHLCTPASSSAWTPQPRGSLRAPPSLPHLCCDFHRLSLVRHNQCRFMCDIPVGSRRHHLQRVLPELCSYHLCTPSAPWAIWGWREKAQWLLFQCLIHLSHAVCSHNVR